MKDERNFATSNCFATSPFYALIWASYEKKSVANDDSYFIEVALDCATKTPP